MKMDGTVPSYKTGLALAVIVAGFYAFYPPSVHEVYLDGGNASFIALSIVWARALGLAGHCLWRGKKMFATRDNTRQGIIGGFFQAISSGFTMLAIHYLPGPLVVVILFTNPLLLKFYMVWRGDTRFDARILFLTVVALAGLALVLDIGHAQSATNLKGMVIAFIAAAAIVPRIYIYGRQTCERDAAVVGAENFLAAAIFTLPVIVLAWPQLPHSLAGLGWMALGAVTLAIGTFYTFYGIAALGSFSWSLSQKLQPVFTALAAALLIGDVLRWTQYAGMAVVLGSLAVYSLFDYRQKAA